MIHNSSKFKHVLHIGPNYVKHKGGIGAVISLYKKYRPDFEFISSYEGNYNSLLNIPYFFLAFFKITFSLVFNTNIRIIHIHGAERGSFYRKYIIFLIGKYIFKKKIYFHLHAAEFKSFFEESNFIIRKTISHLFNNCDYVIVLSKQWFDYINNNFSPKQLIIINNPIELIVKNEIVLKTSNTISFLFLGRIGNRKGIFDLLKLIADNYDNYKNKFTLKIGGDGESERLKSFIYKHSLQDIVEYIGWVDNDSKKNAINQCDIFILPSYNEGLPIAILEAMSFGKPVIATCVGGIPEVIKDGINGFLVEPGNLVELKDKIDYILKHNDRLVQMGSKSLELINNFDINVVINKLQDIYTRNLD